MRHVRFFTPFVLVLLLAASAFAQTPRETRPYRGLFAGTKGNNEQVLAVSFNAGAGYDDDVLLGNAAGARPESGVSPSSTIGTLSGGLSYSLSRQGVSFAITGGLNASYYPVLVEPWVVSESFGTGATFQLSTRTTLTAGASVTNQSLHYLAVMPGLPDPIAPNIANPGSLVSDPLIPEPLPTQPVSTDPALGVRNGNYITAGVGVSVGHSFSRDLSGSLDYSYSDSQQPSLEDYRGQTFGGGVRYMIRKGLSAHLGYHLTESLFGPDGVARLHQADVGIEFNHALSLTRRTTFSFRTGTAAFSDGRGPQFYATGNATLTRELGRTWFATAAYSRDMYFLETFREPVLSDYVSGGVGGLVNRRTQFQAMVGTSKGAIGVTGPSNGFSNVYASAALRIGLTSKIGVTASYSAYRYRFEEGVDLPSGVPSHTHRQSVMVSLNLHSILFQSARRANASR